MAPTQAIAAWFGARLAQRIAGRQPQPGHEQRPLLATGMMMLRLEHLRGALATTDDKARCEDRGKSGDDRSLDS